VTITFCEEGLRRHTPALRRELERRGHQVRTLECFDRCEVCEVKVLVRLEGAQLALGSAADVIAAVTALQDA